MSTIRRATFLALAVAALAGTARAQSPVSVVVGYGPGGPLDIMARLLQPHLSEALAAPVVVKNVPGANAALGAMEVIRSRPDGTTLMLTTGTSLTLSPHTRTTPFRQEDLLPVCQVSEAPVLMMTPPGSGLATVPDVIERARAAPGAFPYATTGPGTTSHVIMVQIERKAGIRANHIPFRSAADAVQAMAAGQVSIFIDQSNLVRQYGLHPLAVFGAERRPEFPDVPTARELGYDVVFALWSGLYAPATTPPAVLDRLDRACARVMRSEAVADAFRRTDMPILHRPHPEFAAFHRAEYQRFGAMVREYRLRVEE